MSRRDRRDTSAERRKREQERIRARNMRAVRLVAVVVIVVAVAALAAFALMRGGGSGPAGAQDVPATATGEVKIPVSDLTSEARFYSSTVDGTKVRFFAMMGSDGQVHVGTDACDVCYGSKKGYHQEGGEMVCNNCGRKFATNSIGTENTAGGCWPSHIDWRRDGDTVVVTAQDLAAKEYMFK
jgi:uncharacterized membrane protein